MKISIVNLVLLGGLTTLLNAGNPGESAMNCLNVTTRNTEVNNVKFENGCSTPIFVVWCGELRFSNKECGDGPNNTFYTHSTNIMPHSDYSTTIKKGGAFKYASCKGGIGFSSAGAIDAPANKNGRFTCLKN